MEVVIDGVKYIPAKEAIANREAVVRGLLKCFWGSLGDSFDEDEKCEGLYLRITEGQQDHDDPTVQEVADLIAEYS